MNSTVEKISLHTPEFMDAMQTRGAARGIVAALSDIVNGVASDAGQCARCSAAQIQRRQNQATRTRPRQKKAIMPIPHNAMHSSPTGAWLFAGHFDGTLTKPGNLIAPR
jgi:hypothetical protein